ncbi:MAG: hypothetical protein J6K14_05700 [Clostridia bacterium]|nr:hypothetical protein [Clostridia bacterium]
MSERYSRIFSLCNNLYTEGAPIVIKAGALHKDNETSWLIAQLKFQNISQKTVKLVKVELKCFDSVERPIEENVTYEYLDLNEARDSDFGSNRPIRIANTSVRSFSARVTEVGFCDNTIWKNQTDAWNPIPAQNAIQSLISDHETLIGYKNIFGNNANHTIVETKDLWLCTCGSINHTIEQRCHKCNSALTDLKSIDTHLLKKEGAYFLACKACQSSDVNQIKEAITIFERLGDFKDSTAQILNAKDQIANAKQREKERKDTLFLLFELIAIIGIIAVNYLSAPQMFSGYSSLPVLIGFLLVLTGLFFAIKQIVAYLRKKIFDFRFFYSILMFLISTGYAIFVILQL